MLNNSGSLLPQKPKTRPGVAIIFVVVVLAVAALVTFQYLDRLENPKSLLEQTDNSVIAQKENLLEATPQTSEIKTPLPEVNKIGLVKIVSPNGGEEFIPQLTSVLFEFDSRLDGCSYKTSLVSLNGSLIVIDENKLFAWGKEGILKSDSIYDTRDLRADYKAKVDVVCTSTHPLAGTYTDTSDDWFSIIDDTTPLATANIIDSETAVKIISPNGGDIKTENNTLQAVWKANNDVGICPATVRLIAGTQQFELDEISLTEEDLVDSPSNQFTASYEIPTSLFSEVKKYRLQVDYQCEGDETIFRDNSDEEFRLLK